MGVCGLSFLENGFRHQMAEFVEGMCTRVFLFNFGEWLTYITN